MARWILKHNIISTIIIVVCLILQQLVVQRVGDPWGILISGVYVFGACAIGAYLCKYKLKHNKRCKDEC